MEAVLSLKMLTKSEIYRLLNDYIGVSDGYLDGFSYATHHEFYPYYCNLDINVKDYEPGTTREKFIRILEEANPVKQAKILIGVFKKIPVSSFPEQKQQKKKEMYDEYQEIIVRLESLTISGKFKNLIFAANGLKPEIVLRDATTNQIEIVRNEEYCLIFDRPLSDEGLLWKDLVDWWIDRENLHNLNRIGQNRELYKRLILSLDGNKPEKTFFYSYYENFKDYLDNKLPALIPQVYLHYDPYTQKYLKNEKRLPRQRMDFLLLLPYRKNIVIEIDGKQHYSQDNRPSPRLYAEMVSEDRRLKLSGYEIYRFGGYEFLKPELAKKMVTDFFEKLFDLYNIGISSI